MKSTFQRSLLSWYQRNKRDLPWRQTRDPYRILVSEVMLQQTQVDTVIPYYHRFLKAFPTFQVLAKAPLGKVLKLWEGLGYYSRARNLHALAKVVVRDYQGRLPNNAEDLRALPGIGPYTAGALLSIAFDKDFAVLDGNVQRVLARHFAWSQNLRTTQTQKDLWALAQSLVPTGRAGDYNQAVMELGALVCTPHSPKCDICPAHSGCEGLKKNLVDQIPLKQKTKTLPHYTIGVGVIWKGKDLLISQRPLDGLLGGLWEFPGGKRKPKESLPHCVEREIKEELNIRVKAGKKIAEVPHAYSHFKITLHAYECRYISGTPQAIGVKAWRWVKPQQLKNFAFPGANQPLLKQLCND